MNNNKKSEALDLFIINISQQLLLAAKTKEPTDSSVNVSKSVTDQI